MKKKILLLFMFMSILIYGQNPTPFTKIKVTGNSTSSTATKVNVQESNGEINSIPKSELIDYVEYSTASNLPIIGVVGKVYCTKDDNKLYRWNSVIYAQIKSGAVDSVAGKTGVVTLDKNDIGLGNVDNTSDVNKPISIATQITFDLKENLANKQNSLAVDGTGTKYPTVDAVNAALPAIQSQINGKADLDGSGKVPLSQINDALLGSVNYKGTYNATTNVPAIPTATSSNKGWYYIISTGGTQQGFNFVNGDWIISNGTSWGKVDNNNTVTSVNGQVGAVSVTASSIGAQTTLTNPTTGVGSQNNPNAYALQDGTILYHSVKWFVPTGTVSTTGTTVTSVGTQFTSAMVGAKLTINGEWRIITGFTSSTVVTVASAYSQNYSAVVAGSWGVYSKAYETLNGTSSNIAYSASGSRIFYIDSNILNASGFTSSNGIFQLNSQGLNLNSGASALWSISSAHSGTKDLGLRRNTAGILEIYDGVTADGAIGNRRDLLARNITATNFNGSATLTGTPTAPTAPVGTNTTQIATTAFVNGELATKQNTLTNPITGTGTTNYLSKFTGASTLGNSLIYDNGTNVGIGTTTPNFSAGGRTVIDINGSSQSILALSVGGVGKGFLFHTNTDLLISNEGNGSVKFNTNGSQKLEITSAGNATFSSSVTATNFNGSATLTGTPTAPTATVGTNTTQIATTAFVQEAVTSNIAQTITNGVTTSAPSQDAVFDALATRANDTEVLHKTGNETKTGTLTLSNNSGNSIVSASISGSGILASAESGNGVSTYSTTGAGIYANSNSGNGISAFSNTGVSGTFKISDASVANIADFKKGSTNKALIGNEGDITAKSYIKIGGTSSQFLMADGSVSTVDLPTSGKYTPTATPVSNISAISYIAPHTYTRVGNIVTVYGASTPTTSSPVSSSYTITLPIPRATATSIGIGFGRGASEGSNELSPLIVNSSSTTTATISFYNTVVGGTPCRYSFQYDITD